MKKLPFVYVSLLCLWLIVGCSDKATSPDSVHVLFLAGENSHGWGSHKHVAGTMLLSDASSQGAPNVTSEMIREWPSADKLARADALVIYADGWGKHPANEHLAALKGFMNQGKGLVVLHWATGIGLSADAAAAQNANQNRIADI